jgi:hypothetical protein
LDNWARDIFPNTLSPQCQCIVDVDHQSYSLNHAQSDAFNLAPMRKLKRPAVGPNKRSALRHLAGLGTRAIAALVPRFAATCR